MKQIFDDVEYERVLLVDASNTFNSLNRRSALLNMFELCPSFATILTNIYHMASILFIDGTPYCRGKGQPRVIPWQCQCMPSA